MSKKKNIPEAIVVDHDTPPASTPAWMLAIGATIAVVAVFAGVTAVLQGRPSEPLRLPPEEVKPAAAAKPEPAPWTYDSVTNQHWDPTHKHWHKGHAPNHGHEGTAPKSAPDIPNPEPWQYDEASNQHFNPDHNHWHGGQPPADKAVTAPVAEAPAPPVAVEVAPAAPVAPTEPVAVEEAVEVPVEPAPAPEPATAP